MYRGDVKPQQTTNTSYHFFRRFKGKTPLICFSDLDPKGIEIALTSHAEFWLTIDNLLNINMPLLGNEQEWYKQKASINFLYSTMQRINSDKKKTFDYSENKNDNSISWQHIFTTLLTHKKTLKQEHMLKHHLTLTLHDINPSV